MTERDWRIFKEDFVITTRGGNIPNPIRRWEESGIPDEILHVIEQVGYTEPTPIQRQAIPIGLHNRDIVAIAQTGSGKTASFVIPMLVYISELPKLTQDNAGLGPYAVILAPSRELALQLEEETKKFSRLMGFNVVSIIGGHLMDEQAFRLRNGAEVIIATPGRLKDCIESHVVVLNQCTYVVMDEADKMINMGFEADVNYILDRLPVTNQKPDDERAEVVHGRQYRQTVMFSATMPPAVERLARKYLRRPAYVTIGEVGRPVESVKQVVEMMQHEDRKRKRLFDLLNEYPGPIIVFVNQKKHVDALNRQINQQGYYSIALHSGKTQEQRYHPLMSIECVCSEAALAKLKNGQAAVLVATDVAARGIDIKDVTLVINYDMPKTVDDYTHRVGRTGRAGKSGVAYTFLTNYDSDTFYDLVQLLRKCTHAKIPPELAHHEASLVKPGTVSQKKRKHEETIYL
jgi:ATP-dependent RNA helicase DDX23/PRP28